ncbi:MAG: metal ABC transporter permease [Leptotrichiaceae bacterium]|nr:metal ABC transporter permease [Leptotrichiaceae bacterium]MBP6281082.1 metal ABC transporter permease [Leptotrichiaceae bacterium]MBP7100639.1 metal ABC transporter permease [Leptotrichiaceae bacterium]MBP7725506.1 metal ABC transporter permease [Leptotrichiaceae bacterium]MBP9630132.1 metal ABC transporter permease [Leptotrichiaceae bacterium]
MEFLNIFEYSFMRNALLVGILSSICCGIIGTYIVNKKMVFISSSISHASYGGIGIGIFIIHFLNLPIKDPLIFGLIFSIFSGILILVLKDYFSVDGDLGIGMIMSLGMAVGIIFSFMTPGYQSDMSTYLFGNILLSNNSNIISLIILNLITIIFFIIFYKGIIYSSFDENFYRLYGVPVKFINYFMVILISSAIIINIKTIGIILIISILTIPQATAAIIAKKYSTIIFLSILFSFLGILFGLLFSYTLNIPSGPSIIIALSLILVFIKIFSFLKK